MQQKLSLCSNKLTRLIDVLGFPLIVLLIAFGNYLVFMVVPNERIMGPMQRIMYFHVGSAMACYCSCAVILAAGVYHLATRAPLADIILRAAGEVGFVFCSIVMLTGMIWGHSAWNTWFNWEPRLVSFLLLWVVFVSFFLLRMFGDPQKVATHSAVLGILGAITVPIVVFSIQLLPQTSRLHPEVIGNRGLKDPLFEYTLFFCMGAVVLLQFYLIWLRTRIGILEASRQ